MEILNDFPSPSSRAVVVVSSFYILSDRDLQLPSILWVNHWQLTLAMRGEFSLADLLDGCGTVVLCSLVMSRSKEIETIRFFESIGVSRVSLVAEGDMRLQKWLHKEPERKAEVGLLPPIKVRPSTLIIGFEPVDFPEEIQRLPQLAFFWKARTYSVDGHPQSAQSAVLSGQLDKADRHQVRKELMRVGVPEFGISIEHDVGALNARLLSQYHKFIVSQSAAPSLPKREDTLVVGFEKTGTLPGVIWWPDPDTLNDWGTIPQSVGRIISSRRLSKWDRLELEQIALRRGISLTFCDIEQKLEELLGSMASSPLAPITVNANDTAGTGEKEMGKKSVDGLPSKSEIVRKCGPGLGWNIDQIWERVKAVYPDYPRHQTAALVYSVRSNMASVMSPAKSPGGQGSEAASEPKLIDIACQHGPGCGWSADALLKAVLAVKPDYTKQRVYALITAARKKLASEGKPREIDLPAAAAPTAGLGVNVLLLINQAITALQSVAGVVEDMSERVAQMEKRLERLAPFEKALEEMGVNAGAR